MTIDASVGVMRRIWLTEWEWACCGDAFAVGDDVDFGIRTRTPHLAFSGMLGPELVATVDAIESHHEDEFADRVRGRVVAVNAVTGDVIERRSLRRPGHGAPPDAVIPAEGEAWPMVGREVGDGVLVGTSPSHYMIEVVSVPDTVILTPVRGVRLATNESEPVASAAELATDPPPERRRPSLAGWIVDVLEDAYYVL
jgi:hypothetical protein